MTRIDEALKLMRTTVRRTKYIGSALSLLSWDSETIMPPNGIEERAQVIGSLATEAFRLTTAPEYGEALAVLAAAAADSKTAAAEGSVPDALTPLNRRMIEEEQRSYERFSRIPTAEYEAFQVLTARAHSTWVEAKRTNDFALYAPTLTQIVEHSRRFSAYWGYDENPYDGHLAGFDPALLSAQIDPIFAQLLAGTQALMCDLPAPVPPITMRVEPDAQRNLALYLLEQIGFNLKAGNLFSTEHPFTARIHAGDTRVTTRFDLDNPTYSIFSVIHEGGHGIFDQNMARELDGTNMDEVCMSVHESQSRFFENIIGRSRGFWASRFDEANSLAGTALAPSVDAFWRSVNSMQPSLIRTEADELTYNLHIIIRYEVERELINGWVSVPELPELWHQKYHEYLGIVPSTDAEGVLQDVHWSSGAFGYFPSYALGNLISAQLAATLAAELGPIEELAASTEGMQQVQAWLTKHVHRHGALIKPAELLQRVTGEPLNPQFLLDYLAQKIALLR